MSAYKGRVAFITGASSGIGASIAEDLVKAGLIVIGGARRVDRIEAIAEKLKSQPGRLIPRKVDVTKESDILDTFKWAEEELGGIDILVNNAALMVGKPIHEHTTEELKNIMDVNVLGGLVASKEIVNSLIRRKVTDGYIINVNSVAGRMCPYIPGNSVGIYPLTKYAMTAQCELLRHDIRDAGIKIRVTSLSPGAVLTEMTAHIHEKGWLTDFLAADDIAKTVNFLLSLPKNVEVTELTIRPLGESFNG